MHLRGICGTVLAALLLLLGLGAPARAATTTTAVAAHTLWQWNVAGNTLHHASTTDGLIGQAVASIASRDADLVALNELCKGQYTALVDALRAAGWPQDSANFARFEPSLPAGTAACRGQEYGSAVFSRAPLGSADRVTLPDDGNAEQRKLLCAPLRDTPHLRFCTTHITTSNEVSANGLANNVNQLNAVLDTIEGFHAAGDTVLIAGDFNAQPHYSRLDPYYSRTLSTPSNASNTGSYRELDDNDADHCLGYGEWTAAGTPGATPPCGQEYAKIDLMFVREDRIVGAYSADSLGISTACTGVAACSDHRIVVGSATVQYEL
ncbi:endonuclease/exonuclease/phosphatase family protein [Streptomyces sp. HUAS MG91]|uniref:Endonuclease/exonuclease/phosphatase family protein n=1 Tax=Streptomyces tabacisoli TaxID=3156398 RepID=A0AAU8J050_9ACTN